MATVRKKMKSTPYYVLNKARRVELKLSKDNACKASFSGSVYLMKKINVKGDKFKGATVYECQ